MPGRFTVYRYEITIVPLTDSTVYFRSNMSNEHTGVKPILFVANNCFWKREITSLLIGVSENLLSRLLARYCDGDKRSPTFIKIGVLSWCFSFETVKGRFELVRNLAYDHVIWMHNASLEIKSFTHPEISFTRNATDVLYTADRNYEK